MSTIADSLLDAVKALTPQQQESVREFINSLRQRSPAPGPFLSAADEFMDQHPELLQRLAQ
jgi:hypothetical protein